MAHTLILALNRIDGQKARIREGLMPGDSHIVSRTWDIRGLHTAHMERLFTPQFMDNPEALEIMNHLSVYDETSA